MSSRRLVEIAVAGAVLVLLLAVLLVRPTAWRTLPPALPLFQVTDARAPDFSSGAYRTLRAAAPGGEATAILYPVEFETPGDVYVLGPGARAVRLALADSMRSAETPKWVGWTDARHLAVTLGDLYGTVSPGGDAFLVDPQTGRASVLWASPDTGRTQALRVRVDPAGRLVVPVARFDSRMMRGRDTVMTLPRSVLTRARASLAQSR